MLINNLINSSLFSLFSTFHNEFIFFIYIFFIVISCLIALKLGKQGLITLLSLQLVLENLFVTKDIVIFGLTATASDALAVGSVFSLNLIQEYFGKKSSKEAIWISFLASLFYTIVSILHINYTSSGQISNCFDLILAIMPRLIIASLITYLITQYTEYYLYGYLTNKFKYKFFIIRNYTSVAITEFLDTVLFSFLGLYKSTANYSNINTILQIIIVSYIIKLIIIFVSAPLLALSKKIIKINK